MPENLNHQLPTPADQPPDPAAAKVAAREARRLLAISRWPLWLLVGLSMLPLSGVLVALHESRAWARALTAAWAVITTVLYVFLARRRDSLLRSGGGRTVSRHEIGASGVSRRDIFLVVVLVGAEFALFALRRYGLIETPTYVHAGVAVGLLAGAAYSALKAVWTRLWEMAFVAALFLGLAGVSWVVSVGAMRAGLWAVALTLAAATITVGLSFLGRWRNWVRSLPPEDGGTPEARP